MSAISISSLDNLGLELDSPGVSNAMSMSANGMPTTGRRLSFSCSKFAMDKAAQGGHVDVLQLLHDQVTHVDGRPSLTVFGL